MLEASTTVSNQQDVGTATTVSNKQDVGAATTVSNQQEIRGSDNNQQPARCMCSMRQQLATNKM
jgi:hypothetical protein